MNEPELRLFLQQKALAKIDLDHDVLYQHKGQYSIVTAKSNREVDVNLDGVSSTDLLNEIPDLKYSYLGLKFTIDGRHNLFYQFWQNQSLSSETPVASYDPKIVVTYINQGTTGLFNIEDTFPNINLFGDDETPQTKTEFPLPKNRGGDANR